MNKLLESKITAWFALILVIALIVVSALLHTPWWGYFAIFFLFMAVFSHIASLYLRKINRSIGTKLEVCALVSISLSVIGFLVEYVLYNFDFGL